MSEVLSAKLLTNPWVVLPMVALAAVLAAYLLSAAVLWVLKRLVDRGASDRERRLYRTLQGYLMRRWATSRARSRASPRSSLSPLAG
jgi:hypothetical protein